MKIGQIRHLNNITAAIFDSDGTARPIPDYTLYDVIRIAEMENNAVSDVARRLAASQKVQTSPIIPLNPKEVWACGCTYEASATFRDSEHGTREGFYAHVHRDEARPEIFFKGTARVCVGPGGEIGIRPDSKFTAPEPELAIILGSNGKILGYTLANDVSAWDIERENPLYLPQSKVYTACCALGPVILTDDQIADPKNLTMTCTITRAEATVFEGSVNTSKIGRSFETLIEYLLRSNPVPAGSVLLTGTGIIVKEDAALQPGDVVTIEIPEIGRLSNPAAVV